MSAELHGKFPAECDGVVLVLHGGAEESTSEVHWLRLPVLRLLPFALAAKRACGSRVGVVRLKNNVRGWNAPERSPIADAEWALQQIRAQQPAVPIVMMGHSMGGRVVLNLIEEPNVVGVAALAPWIVDIDGVHGRAGQHALLMHGVNDRMTNPQYTEQYAEKLRARGVETTWIPVTDENHAMLRKASHWHTTAAEFARDVLRKAQQ